MEDFSSMSESLRDLVASPDRTEERVTKWVERCLLSNSSSERFNAAKIVKDMTSGSDKEAVKRARLILGETALTYIPALLGLLRYDNIMVEELMLRICEYGRPREVVMALNEALQDIEERAEKAELSDEEEDEVYIDFKNLAQEFLVILLSYIKVIVKLPNKKSTSTLLALSDAISPLLSCLYQTLDVEDARDTLFYLSRLVSNAWKWSETTEDKGGEQKAILSKLLFMTITLLVPRGQFSLLEHWFLATFPKYDRLSEPRGNLTVLPSCLMTAKRDLGYSSEALVDRLINPSSTSPYSALAALHLLTVEAVESASSAKPITTAIPSTLGDCMPVLSAALSSVAVDTGCTFAWSMLHRGATVDSDTATLMIELLMHLTALPANDITRTALTKLLEAIISTQPAESKLMLLKQLLEPENPFVSLRLVAFPILRQNIISDSTLLTPSLLQTLGPIFFTIPTQDDISILQLDIEDLVSTMYPSWMTECANILWFLYDFDKGNQTGIRNEETIETIKRDWLGPIMARWNVLSSQMDRLGDEAVQVKFVIQRWGDAVARANYVLAKQTL